MNRLRQELGVAPRAGIAVAAVVALAAAVALVSISRGGPQTLRISFGALMATVVLIYGFVVAYVWGDAKRRGMRHRIWTLVAALVPNALGILAYFLLRDPLLRRCGGCGAGVRRDLAFCPQCGSAVARLCPTCRQPVETEWSHCARCGAQL